MAITDVRQLRSLSVTESKGGKGTIQLTGTQEFLVICDTANPSFTDIAQDEQAWPKIGGPLPKINDSAFFSGFELNVTSRQFAYYDEENEFAVKVSVQYDAKADEETNESGEPSGSGSGGDTDTWHRLSFSTQSVQVPLKDKGQDGDKDNHPARNSAGDPVDGLTEDRALLKLTYTNTKVRSPDFSALLKYVNKTNKMPFLGAPVRTLRCMGFSGEYDDKNQLWTISVEFLYDPEEWVVRYWDVGFNELIDGERVAIVDILGNPVSKPVPLDGNGRAVEPGLIGTGSLLGDAVKLTAYPYLAIEMQDIFSEARI